MTSKRNILVYLTDDGQWFVDFRDFSGPEPVIKSLELDYIDYPRSTFYAWIRDGILPAHLRPDYDGTIKLS